MRRLFLLLFVYFVLALPATWAATYTVTNTNDSGAGSFRQAILNANANVGPDSVVFSSSFMYITLASYVRVDDTVNLSGSYAVINGNNASNLVYFAAGSDGSTITAMAFTRSTGYGLSLASNCNRVYNCALGTNFSGTAGLGNNIGLSISGHYNDIGGTLLSGYNIISGNTSYGLSLYNAVGNRVHGNYIGTNGGGTLAVTNGTGIQMYGSSMQNMIGGDRTAALGNLICGNTNYGVYLSDTTVFGNTLAGNTIGVNPTQDAEIPNGVGIMIHQAGGNAIGLPASGFDNVIAGNNSYGIHLWCGSSTSNPWPQNNRIQNNYIGVCPDTENAFPNTYGIYLNYAAGNLIGGNCYLLEGNVISGNSSHGVCMLGGMGNTLSGNFIGTTKSGTAPQPNTGCGIRVIDGSGNYIGGINLSYALRSGNLISGNGQHGISFERTIAGEQQRNNTIVGNWIGTNIYGDAAIPNAQSGINFYINAGDNQIGSANALYRNLISGNGGYGFRSHYGFNNKVYGNYIGTNLEGTARLANVSDALYWTNSYRNRIGGTNAGEGNVICGSSTNGIYLADSFENTIIANTIGPLADLSLPTPNFTNGIFLTSWSYTNWIGLETANKGNLIAGTVNGVNVDHDYSDGVMLSTNTICAFSGSGISLATGANNNQATPAITSHDANWLYGTCVSGDDVIEVFVADRGTGNSGGSLRYVGRTTAIIGTSWGLNVPGRFGTSGEVFTAIATNGMNSSAFSANYMIPFPTTPTSTATPTASHTPSATVTHTPSQTPTITATATLTRTSTTTVTATATLTPTPGNTLTNTGTPTPTGTATPTSTMTLSVTMTGTRTPGNTATYTWTPTATVPSTRTATPSTTPSSTASTTFTPTKTSSVTGTVTPRATATPTSTASLTGTVTPWVTATPTSTASPTRTVTPWVTSTPTATATLSSTQSPVVTTTSTPTSLATRTDAASWTPTATIKIVAFPQPARERVKFRIPEWTRGPLEILIYNAAGEQVAKVDLSGPSAGQPVWLTHGMSPGLYIARIYLNGEFRRAVKFVVVP